MAHKQLTMEQRYHIYGLWQGASKQVDIAKALGVHKSTISRELKRNMFWWCSREPQYKPDYAQAYCEARHTNKKKQIKLTTEVQSFVREKLRQEWSPERAPQTHKQ